jgi:large subunit ribosomal protein L29
MTAKEIRELPSPELDRALREQRQELVGLRLKKSSGQVQNTAHIRTLRRGIARLETLKREKTLAHPVGPAKSA